MEDYIPITALNDFTYSPKSLYFHSVYAGFDLGTYHDLPQKQGLASHASSDEQSYTSKRYITAMYVYSDSLTLLGKIDLYDTQSKTLT